MIDSGALREELIQLTVDLIRFPSTADEPAHIRAAIDYIADYLAPVPGLFLYRSERAGKPALVATLHDTRTPTLLLNGHLDVVAARPEQFVPQVTAERIRGRGSQDMKGSVAVLMRLLKDLAALEERPDVGFQFVGDEEIGGEHGTRRLAEEGWSCSFFLAAEPTDMQICHEHKGGVWIELQLPGTAAHASRPWDGHNPIAALGDGLQGLNRHFPPLDEAAWRTTVVPTRIRSAEGSPNQLPPHATIALDIRYTADDTPDGLIETVQSCFPDAAVTGCKRVSPLRTRPDDPALMGLATVTSRVRGRPTAVYREHFASDARFYSDMGIPAVCFGPCGGGLHSEDEWVEIDSLVEFYRVLHEYILTEAPGRSL